MTDTYRTLTDQIDRMRKQGFLNDSVPLSTLLAWHGGEMAMNRDCQEQARLARELGERAMRAERECIALRAEIVALRTYGNKDCTAMADEFLQRAAKGHAS